MVQRTLGSTACAIIASGVSCGSDRPVPAGWNRREAESANAAVPWTRASIAAATSTAIRVAEHDEERRRADGGPRIAGSPRLPAISHFPRLG